MFGRFKNTSLTFEDAIERLLLEMNEYDPDSDTYQNALASLERVSRVKCETKKTRVSADTIALVLGNLLGILIIVGYEQTHVITSKGLGFIKYK
mgnify:CR=1 FL=1